jgi:hypothetical protein
VALYGFNKQDSSALVKVARREGLRPPNSGGLEYPDAGFVPGIPFKNNNAGTVPAWGLMRITGRVAATSTVGGYLTTDKPDSTYRWLYLVNGPSDVVAAGYGYGTFLTDPFLDSEDFAHVLYDTGNTPAYGEEWGPKDDSWLIWQHRPGFFIFGGPTGSGSTARVSAMQMQPGEILVFNAGSSIAAAGTGTATLYGGTSGSEATLGLTVTVRNLTSSAWGASKYGFADLINGQGYVSPIQT